MIVLYKFCKLWYENTKEKQIEVPLEKLMQVPKAVSKGAGFQIATKNLALIEWH